MPDSLVADAVPNLIKELTRARRPEAETRVFSMWRHDADLLPKLEARLNSLMAALKKHPADVYDIQGRRDEGVDIFVKRPEGPICFQVKSDLEMDEPNIVDKIRLQHSRALESYETIEDYYIVVCADLTGKGRNRADQGAPKSRSKKAREAERQRRRREVRDRALKRRRVLREINQLARIDGVSVISPTAALGMLRLSDAHLDAFVTARFSSADSVVADARTVLAPLTYAQRAIVARLAWERIFGGSGGRIQFRDLAHERMIVECYSADSQIGFIPYQDPEWRTISESEDDAEPLDAPGEPGESGVVFARGDIDESVRARTDYDLGELVLGSADGEQSFEQDLETLNGRYLQAEDEYIELDPWATRAVLALLLDGVVRYGHDRASASMEYLLSVA